MKEGLMSFAIAVLCEKGGIGKTMLSTNIAGWLTLAYPDKTVGILDTCFAHHSMNWLGTRAVNQFPELFDVEFNPSAMTVGLSIAKMKKRHDFVVVDGHPKLDELMKNSAAAADLIVIPVRPEKADFESATRTAGYLLASAPSTPMAFLLTDWDDTNNAKDIYNDLLAANEEVKLPIIGTPRNLVDKEKNPHSIIIGRTAWSEAAKIGKTVFEVDTANGPAIAEANKAFIQLMELAQ